MKFEIQGENNFTKVELKNISLKIKQNVIFKKYNLFLPHASILIINHKKYNKKKNFSYYVSRAF